MEFYNDLWVSGVPLLEKIIRSILVYFFLLIALRLGGKRELGQMTGFDLVVLLLISNTVQNAIIGNDNSVLGGFVGAATLLMVNYIVVRLAYRHSLFLRILEGEPTILVKNGQIIVENLASEVITQAELKASLRRQGFRKLSDVKRAILETDGSLSVEPQSLKMDEGTYQQHIMEQLDRIEEMLKQKG
ncbi:DUF421 domain-containing protein [Aphanothece hegewaldii CCALA 016]|uniref:DUF421 domain-containing protein n=1 Tax=Aphanothece hegewaldii CCALA 016 TaxID=2107694 RepID=A0A2T1M072_9CHRO|nr:YetF domain-containing protein [Aphanothece hegewaldii]PSF38047.1 DUF421 domain-containing protein [Aphanothece hegewaldii CCALA 016]